MHKNFLNSIKKMTQQRNSHTFHR